MSGSKHRDRHANAIDRAKAQPKRHLGGWANSNITLPEVFDLDAKAQRLAQAAHQGRPFYGMSGPFDSGASLATPFWVGYPPLRGMRFRSTSKCLLPKLPAAECRQRLSSDAN
jgi:hypothetical protein